MAHCGECNHYCVCRYSNNYQYPNAETCMSFVPTADVAEVTRCSNCKYIKTFTCPITRTETLFCDYGEKPVQVAAEHYCGYGERKDM